MVLASAANGKLSVVPTANSYFYETFPCQAASSDGYNAITFSVKGPAGASFTLEIQTKGSCSASTYQSYFHQVSGLTGVSQTISVPLSSFAGANAMLLRVLSGVGSLLCLQPGSSARYNLHAALSLDLALVPHPE